MLTFFLLSTIAQANSDWALLFREIQQNNSSLEAFRLQQAGAQAERTNSIRWDDLQLDGYYLNSPDNPNSYLELEVSQSIPSLLSVPSQRRWLTETQSLADTALQAQAQELLLEATHELLSLVLIDRQKQIAAHRFERAQKHLEHYAALLAAGEITAAELQKVQLVALQYQLELQELDRLSSTHSKNIERIKGSPLQSNPSDYPRSIEAIDLESLWTTRRQQDPGLRKGEQAITATAIQHKLAKQAIFPDLSVGFNRQGIQGETYSGLYLGLSVPLYKVSSQISAAAYHHQQALVQQMGLSSLEKTKLDAQYQAYNSLLEQYTQLKTILDAVDYEQQLESQLSAGILSFVEYHQEYEFYAHSEDRLLELEFQLQVLLSELYKHTLLEAP